MFSPDEDPSPRRARPAAIRSRERAGEPGEAAQKGQNLVDLPIQAQ